MMPHRHDQLPELPELPRSLRMTVSTTSLVTGVDFVSVPTRDLPAAMDFYGEVLGLPRSSVWQRAGEEALGAEFETGNLTLALIASERLGIPFQPNSVPVALRVDDVEAGRAQLESRGIEFGADTIDSGVCHMAHFRDPDGNVLMLHHRYAPRTEGASA
jgi:predicted enzyme related to lactoylglutathione lyase